MKKFLIAIAALTTVAATPAFAESSKAYNINASVGSVCGVFGGGTTNIAVAFSDLALTSSATELPVGAGSATYRCNSPVGFTRTISSLNKGNLVRTGGNGDASNSVPFTMSHGGGNSAAFTPVSLATPKVNSFDASAAFLSGQTGSINFQVKGVANINTNANDAPGTTVYAGNYTDTVTIAITAN